MFSASKRAVAAANTACNRRTLASCWMLDSIPVNIFVAIQDKSLFVDIQFSIVWWNLYLLLFTQNVLLYCEDTIFWCVARVKTKSNNTHKQKMMTDTARGNEHVAAAAEAAEMMRHIVESAASVHEEQQPEQVFDLSLIQQQQQKQLQITSSIEHREHGVASRHFPPLESLTTEDDNTSVSSVSTQGSIQRRSMFSQYWKKTGQEPPRYLPISSSCGAAISPTSSPCHAGVGFLATPPEHEAVLDVQVPSMTAAAASHVSVSNKMPSRRTMFSRGGQPFIRPSSSAPSLSSYQDQDSTPATTPLPASGSPRKTRSYSHLLSKQPSTSCLRESRFSPNKASIRRDSSTVSTSADSASIVSVSSVRFDMAATSVVHYDLPQERYAEEGWCNYFK